MKAIIGSLVLASLLLTLAFVQPPRASGCATVGRKGDSARIASESALIVWDEKTKTQHFIRRASFQTRAPYFGFLVPTPTRPALAETPDEVFGKLEDWTRREVKTVRRYRKPPIYMSAAINGSKAASVEVVEQGRVADFDYTVLKTADNKELREWLDKYGYDARPRLLDWVEPYVKQGWFITAFQIAKKDKEDNHPSTKGVRMSFTTDRPFFPYREPAEEEADAKSGRHRLLRVFVVSGQRMHGSLGDAKTPWQGNASWANPLQEEQRDSLAELLDRRQVPVREGAWLTVFDDESSPRAGETDLFFSPSSDQSTLKRPPIIREEIIWVPYEWLCLLAFAAPTVVLVVVVGRRWWSRKLAG